MRPFEYVRATDAAHGVAAVTQQPGARFLAGGSNLIDLMKEDIERPVRLVDISHLPLTAIERGDAGLAIGALARNADTANHPLVRERYPLLTEAIVAGASGQIRNMATNGGNLLQRTRCPYFYDIATPCNKRQPGSGCAARQGLNRIHALFGWSDACVATYPGDMANALVALDARITLLDADGARRARPLAELYRLPDDTPHLDTTLPHGALIVGIELPDDAAAFAPHSHYLKVRDRASYAFAMVSVAAALEIDGGVVRRARIVMGGVSHMPWRSTAAETLLVGEAPTAARFEQAAEVAFRHARPLAHNEYKIPLGKRAVARALAQAARLA